MHYITPSQSFLPPINVDTSLFPSLLCVEFCWLNKHTPSPSMMPPGLRIETYSDSEPMILHQENNIANCPIGLFVSVGVFCYGTSSPRLNPDQSSPFSENSVTRSSTNEFTSINIIANIKYRHYYRHGNPWHRERGFYHRGSSESSINH